MRLLTVVLGRPRNSRTTVGWLSIYEWTGGRTHTAPPTAAFVEVDSRSNGSAPTADSWAARRVRLCRSGRGQAPASARYCGGDWRSPPLPQRAVGTVDGVQDELRNDDLDQLAVARDREARLCGQVLYSRSTQKLVRTHPIQRCPTGQSCQRVPVGLSETSPRVGAGVVFID